MSRIHHEHRTALYARVSTRDQDPAMQLQELRASAAHRGLTIVEECIDSVRGTREVRLARTRLWRTVRARQVDTVLV